MNSCKIVMRKSKLVVDNVGTALGRYHGANGVRVEGLVDRIREEGGGASLVEHGQGGSFR